MLFNSWAYALFLASVLLLYGRLSHRGQNRMPLLASDGLYGAWDVRFLDLIVRSTVADAEDASFSDDHHMTYRATIAPAGGGASAALGRWNRPRRSGTVRRP